MTMDHHYGSWSSQSDVARTGFEREFTSPENFLVPRGVSVFIEYRGTTDFDATLPVALQRNMPKLRYFPFALH